MEPTTKRGPLCSVSSLGKSVESGGLVGRKRTRGPEDDTLCMVFDQDAVIFFLLSFCFFSLWSRKLHLRYAHRYFLDIYDTLEQSKELSRRGF